MSDVVAPADNAWSFSGLKAYEDCPHRYHETRVLKKWGEERSPHLVRGETVHVAMANALMDRAPLPPNLELHSHWIEKVKRTPGHLLVEDDCRFAITRDKKPIPWFSPRVWLRVIGDAAKLDDDVALVIDWKTGKSRNADPLQLILTSMVFLATFPKLQAVRSDFVFLDEDKQITQTVYRHELADNWAVIMPRAKKLEQATLDQAFPPKPGPFCKNWCPVKSCEHYGK